jgi:virulence factor Mce-like protein
MKPGGIGPARIATMVVFAFSCFGLLLFLWLSFGGPVPLKPKAYRFDVAFPEATTLAVQADVRVAGVSVGKVVSKVADPKGNRTLATIEVLRKFAPIHNDAKAKLRQKTLLGETYVELNIGTQGTPELAEGGRLDDGQVEEAVEFDEFLEIFPKETQQAFRRWQSNSAEVIDGRDRDLNAALGNLGPFAEDGSHLLQVLDRRRGALKALVRETGTVFGALTEDEDALRAFLADTAHWFQATASERENLAESIKIFPTFLDESKATLARLQTFAIDTDPLLVDLQPVLQDAQPTLRDLRTLSPDLKGFFVKLPALIDASADGMPALASVLRALEPTFAATGPFLAQLNPLLQWLEINNGKVSDFLGAGPAALAGKRSTNQAGGQGHVLPQLITTGSQSILMPERSSDNRGNTYLKPSALAPDPRYKDTFVYPNWDCVPSGGEKKADDTPGCYVQEPIPFKGANDRFPRIREDIATK